MLHFDREPSRPSHLVALERDDDALTTTDARLRALLPVLLVVAASLFAILVDLIDDVPAWSHYASALSVVVLAAHALLNRR